MVGTKKVFLRKLNTTRRENLLPRCRK